MPCASLRTAQSMEVYHNKCHLWNWQRSREMCNWNLRDGSRVRKCQGFWERVSSLDEPNRMWSIVWLFQSRLDKALTTPSLKSSSQKPPPRKLTTITEDIELAQEANVVATKPKTGKWSSLCHVTQRRPHLTPSPHVTPLLYKTLEGYVINKRLQTTSYSRESVKMTLWLAGLFSLKLSW